MKRILIFRSEEENPSTAKLIPYEVPDKIENVLQALIYIREYIDSSLAFRFGCRYKKCGLCAMNINDTPAMACLTPLENDTVIKPLAKFPIIRDLIIDRTSLEPILKRPELMASKFPLTEHLPQLKEPNDRKILMKCVECLCCMESCPKFEIENPEFCGPLSFVKLAQLKLHPLNTIDYRNEAIKLGLEKCSHCKQCYCPYGIDIVEQAIVTLTV